MKKNILVLLGGIFLVNCSFSATINEHLYILRDSLNFSDGSKVPYITFNTVETFNSSNARIELNVSDQLDL